ncbi:MAG: N-acetylmuramoyl-L-alanine amidase [Lachnospira sp.]
MCKGHNIIYLSTIIKKQTSLLIVALMFVFCVNLWGCGTEGTDALSNSGTVATNNSTETSATLKTVNDMANENRDKHGNADGAETPLASLDNETASGQEVVTEQSEGIQQPETTEQTASVFEATSVAEVTSATETTRRVTVICIDPGHGGESQGTHYVYDDKEIEEKNINYYMACKLKSYLEEYPGIKVVIDRGQNEDPDFETRIGFAKENKADYIVSLHVNSKSRDDIEPSGCMAITTRSHYQAEDAVNDDIYTASSDMATSILSQLNNLGIKITTDWDANKTGGILRRKGNGTYPDGSSCDYYGLIRNATYAGIPAVIIEHAFLSNESDYRKYLSSNSKLDALAMADCKGIIEYLNSR